MSSSLMEISAALDNSPDKAYDIWKEKKDSLSAILKHGDIDSLDEEMENVKRNSDNKDKQKDAVEKASVMIKSILGGEKLSFGNVF